MRGTALCAALALIACARQEDSGPPTNVTTIGGVAIHHGGSGDGSGSGSGIASCPMLGASGSFVASDVLGQAGFDLAMDLAVDRNGNIAVVRNGAGVAVLSPQLQTLFSFAFGSFAEFDASGNLFVVGSFTQPTDFGLGVIVPNGNIDVFVAELDAHGHVIFAKALGLCGADLLGMAIDRVSGRIAISGSALGTIVVDASGAVVFSLDKFGKVAFDLHGNLVVAGAVGGNGFVAEVGDTGGIKGIQTFTSTGSIDVRALAIGPSGEIVFGGNFTQTIDLFGTTLEEHSAEVGITFDTFLVKLDGGCNPVVVEPRGLPGRDIDGIAIDIAGNILVVGDNASGQAFGRLSVVTKLGPDGSFLFTDTDAGSFPNPLGEALAVAVDSCGAIFVGDLAADPISAGGALHAVLFEIAP